MRRLLAIVVLLVVSGCAASTPAAAPPPASARPLRILLVNDDGWDAPGITAVRAALVRAGNQVTEVAPLSNQSGTGASLTLRGALRVTHPTGDPTVWAVDGRPADATLVGLRSVLGGSPPDLVVSGTNADLNPSVFAIHSGTVGAAMTAAEYGVPALAVSTGLADGQADYTVTADYVARLAAALSATTPVLPPGTLLNVNYPHTGDGQRAAGVVAVPVADATSLTLSYTPGPDGSYAVATESTDPSAAPDSDVAALARGQVTISPIAVDLDRPAPDLTRARELAAAVAP